MPGCSLNTGYTIECPKDSLGGLRSIRIANLSDIESIAQTGGVVNSITMKPGTAFYGFEFPRNTCGFTITPTTNRQNGTKYYLESLTLVLNKMQIATTAIVESLVEGTVVIIVEDNNRNAYLLGKTEGMAVSGGTIGSGTSAADRNGYELTLEGEEPKITHMAADYILITSGACYFVARDGSRFVARDGESGLVVACEDGAGDFALVDFTSADFN